MENRFRRFHLLLEHVGLPLLLLMFEGGESNVLNLFIINISIIERRRLARPTPRIQSPHLWSVKEVVELITRRNRPLAFPAACTGRWRYLTALRKTKESMDGVWSVCLLVTKTHLSRGAIPGQELSLLQIPIDNRHLFSSCREQHRR